MTSYAELLEEWSTASGGDNLSLQKWAELRLSLAEEEYLEWREALEFYVTTGDPKPMAKESADLGYVIWGAAARPRIDLDAAFREVHRSNMSKFGPNGEVYTREDGKVLKGPYYREADMSVAILGDEKMSRGEAAVQWVEDGLRAIPIITRIILILFLVACIGTLATTFAYTLAGGR